LLDAVGSGVSGVIVDFAEVDYISSAGLHALMKAIRQRKECRLAVAALRPIVQEIFQIARFQHVVQISDSIEEVTASWSETPAAGGPPKGRQTGGGQA
jgi:anti-sigma B factor antagonist